MTALLKPLINTARNTNLRFITLFLITSISTYLITHVINMITAPINATYSIILGVTLILLTTAAGVTLIGTLALDQTDGETPSLPAAFSNLPRTLRAAGFLLTTGILMYLSLVFAGTIGLGIMFFLITWFTPLTLYPLLNEDGNPFTLVAEGIGETLRNATRTLTLACVTITLNSIGPLTIIGVIYTFPYTVIAQTLLYTDIYSTT